MTETPPWHGVIVASALPLRDDLSVDSTAYAEHVAFLADGGCDGIVANGSLGEYQTLTAEERAAVVRTAVDAAPDGLPGDAGRGRLRCGWSPGAGPEHAAEAGASTVMLLPPNAYRADDAAVLEHYREVAKVGLPVVAYNNPFDTKVDLTPELLARLHGEGLIVAVKEFSGDLRRPYQIAELAPGLDVLVGSDEWCWNWPLAGAVGWIAGYPERAAPACVELYRAAVARRPGDRAARSIGSCIRCCAGTPRPSSSRRSSCRWTWSGRQGGACRPPRRPLLPEQERRSGGPPEPRWPRV